MIKVTKHLPKTAVELFEILPEGLLCEVIENTIYLSPGPDFSHQDLSAELHFQFLNEIKKMNLGKCITAPIDVFLDAQNAFQPDIIFIAKENLHIIKNGKIKGSPDLVIEILSPGSIKNDTVTKKKVYERCGIKEYFIVSPKTKDVITYYLKDKKYEKQNTKKGKITSKLLNKTFSF